MLHLTHLNISGAARVNVILLSLPLITNESLSNTEIFQIVIVKKNEMMYCLLNTIVI